MEDGSNMKRLLFILTALLMIAATGCKKEDKKIDYKANLIGEWHCAPDNMDADIYVEFAQDGSFALYQQVGEGRYRNFSGSWECEENILSGTYADGTPWGSSYQMDFDDDTMTLTAMNGSNEVMTYIREDIPGEVLEDCIVMKSSGSL